MVMKNVKISIAAYTCLATVMLLAASINEAWAGGRWGPSLGSGCGAPGETFQGCIGFGIAGGGNQCFLYTDPATGITHLICR